VEGFAIRNEHYKLIKFENGDEEFYNLSTDAYENSNLLLSGNLSADAVNAKSNLEAEAIRIKS
jgi:hypothetical protein